VAYKVLGVLIFSMVKDNVIFILFYEFQAKIISGAFIISILGMRFGRSINVPGLIIASTILNFLPVDLSLQRIWMTILTI
jgi:hypothetical protein